MHLKHGRQCLDQHGGFHAAVWQTEFFFGQRHHIVPERGFFHRLELGQVEVRAAIACMQCAGVVKREQAKVDQCAGNRVAVYGDVPFRQVPAARAYHQSRRVGADAVELALWGVEFQRAVDRVAQIDLAIQLIGKAGRGGILEVGHEHLRAGVQRVDDHLALDRAGDFHTAVLQSRGNGGHGPVAFADLPRIWPEVRQDARVVTGLTFTSSFQQLPAPRFGKTVQARQKGKGVGGKDVLVAGGVRINVDGPADELFARYCHGLLLHRGVTGLVGKLSWRHYI